MMKKLFSLLFVAMTMVSLAHASTVVINGSEFTGGTESTGSSVTLKKNGVTISTDKGYAAGTELRVYAGGKLTISATSKMTAIAFEHGQKTKLTLQDVTPNSTTFTADATKQIRLTKITITLDGTGTTEGGEGGDEGGDDEGGEGGDESGLNEEYVYSEPTVVENHDSVGNNMAYSFIQNNIKVDCTKGARTGSYFSCNAGSSITFTATKNIKGLVIDGYVKKGFEATATAGSIDYVDAYDEEVTADPVLVITDINSKSITIDCDKQMRCYSVEFYFDANPTATIGGGGSGDEGDYNFDFEPTEPTALTINIADSIILTDAVSDYGIIDAYMWNDDYEVELYFNVAQADPTSIIPLGVYVINDSEEAGTMTASPGGDDFYDYPSVIMGDWTYEEETEWTEAGWYYNEAYYIETGIADVTMSGDVVTISIEATTHFGSTVALTCTYKVETSTALEQVEAAAQPAKMMHRGQLMIRRGNHLFNAQGAALK